MSMLRPACSSPNGTATASRSIHQKLLAGIRIAAVKRPVSSERMKSIANYVEDRIQCLGRAEVTSEVIGNLVLDQLADVDQVAYIRFASVYLDFSDLSEIRSEVDRVMGRSDLEARGLGMSRIGSFAVGDTSNRARAIASNWVKLRDAARVEYQLQPQDA